MAQVNEEEILDFVKRIRTSISIDKYDLSKECQKQPDLYCDVGDMFVRVKTAAKIAKEELELERARLDADIRMSPEKYGLAKLTEGCISSTIISQTSFTKAKQLCIAAEELSDMLQILLASIEQRKSMLRDLVSLYIYDYYSNDNMGSEKGKLRETAEEKIAKLREERALGNKADQA